MTAKLNRRNWLKTSAALSAGVAMAASHWDVYAKPLIKEQAISRNMFAQMVADPAVCGYI